MTSTVEFINRWQRIALLSQSLLELAQRGEWDLLLQQEVSYLQSIETVMEKQTPPGITRSIQDMVAGYIKQTLDNEQLLKGLLQQRLDELSSLIGQSTRQKSLNNAYGRLSGMLLRQTRLAPHNIFPSRMKILPYSRGRLNDFWSTEDENPTLLQYFHWYYPDGGKLWSELAERADGLNDIGINMVWLPPACKGASGGYSVGYDTYDLFDLGEFDQKGTIATKYGDKRQLLTAIDALKK